MVRKIFDLHYIQNVYSDYYDEMLNFHRTIFFLQKIISSLCNTFLNKKNHPTVIIKHSLRSALIFKNLCSRNSVHCSCYSFTNFDIYHIKQTEFFHDLKLQLIVSDESSQNDCLVQLLLFYPSQSRATVKIYFWKINPVNSLSHQFMFFYVDFSI